ncbi:MAG: hypothetical protein ABL921_17360 [Pirellula sp.]
MRPSELFAIRPGDIDRSGIEWMYRPPEHKNKSKGKGRSIPIVGDAREALEDYMNRPQDSYRRAIVRAAELQGVPSWHPYQIIHLNLTQIRDVLGVEHAQAMAGHSNIRI